MPTKVMTRREKLKNRAAEMPMPAAGAMEEGVEDIREEAAIPEEAGIHQAGATQGDLGREVVAGAARTVETAWAAGTRRATKNWNN